jgi:hypothetical protein
MRRRLSIALALGAVLLIAGWTLWQARVERQTQAARAPVSGGDAGGLARADPVSEQFDGAALAQAAAAAAAEPGFQTLIVMRHEHVVLERYGAGTVADTVVDSGAFAAGVLGLLVGIAAHDDLLNLSGINGFNADRLQAAIEAAAHTPYALYLERKLWRPLNAAPAWIALSQPGGATPAGCCLHARVIDWMRVAGVLVGEGRFEGTIVVPPAWIARMMRPVSADGRHGFGIELAGAAQGSEPFALADACFLRGPAHWRLWMLPSAHLAVLFGAADASQSWDETQIANRVLRALTDLQTPNGPSSLLQRLVPGH